MLAYYSPRSLGMFADGTAAAPSIAFASDPDTGFYWGGSGNIYIALDGLSNARFASDGAQNFLIATLNANKSLTLQTSGTGGIALTSGASGSVAIGPTTATTNLVRIGVVSDQTSRGLITWNNTFTDSGYMGICGFSTTLKYQAGTHEFSGNATLAGSLTFTDYAITRMNGNALRFGPTGTIAHLYASTTTAYFGNNSGGGGAGISFTNGNAASITTGAGVTALSIDSSQNATFAAQVRITNSQTPASAAATGTTGTIAWDASYFYVCTASNTWRRVAHATW